MLAAVKSTPAHTERTNQTISGLPCQRPLGFWLNNFGRQTTSTSMHRHPAYTTPDAETAQGLWAKPLNLLSRPCSQNHEHDDCDGKQTSVGPPAPIPRIEDREHAPKCARKNLEQKRQAHDCQQRSIVRTCIRPPHSPTLSSGANEPGTVAANSIASHGRLMPRTVHWIVTDKRNWPGRSVKQEYSLW